MATAKVTDATFEQEVLKANVPVVVDFFADWCQPCKAIAPYLEEISQQMAGKVKIAKINVDENQRVPMTYNIRAMPTLLIFKDGKVVAQQVGALPKGKLAEWIQGAMA
ncbi:MAG: thioredoxin [Rhizobiales bacterium]|nr:thioredoxin [Hyphomicrobiales bacterium]